MRRVILVNGSGGVGKDTFIQFCRDYLVQQYKIPSWLMSAIEPIKAAAYMLGWDGKKDDKGRKYLSDIKILATKYCDLPFLYLMNELRHVKVGVAFVVMREPPEIEKFVKATDAHTVLILRDDADVPDNEADRNVMNYTYDTYVMNNGTLEQLDTNAKRFCDMLMEGQK